MTMTELTGTLTGMVPAVVAGGVLHHVSRRMSPAAKRRRAAVRKPVKRRKAVKRTARKVTRRHKGRR